MVARKRKNREQPTLSTEGRKYGTRTMDAAYWGERKDRIADLEKRWNFISSRSPDHEGEKYLCDYRVHGRPCKYRRVAASTHWAPMPLRCRFHLTIEFAGDLALLLREDPGKVSERYTMGCLRFLVEERLKGGPTAIEAQESLQGISDALLAWPAGAQRQQPEGQ